jgi:hypothetical protein
MALTMHGKWRLRVTSALGERNNRFVISGAAAGNGAFPLEVGTEIEVDGLPEWQLDAQFEDPEQPGSWISVEVRIQKQDRTLATLPTTLWSFHTLTTGSGGLLVPRGDVWEATFIGPMMEIPYRPWAIREEDRFALPDGIFDASLGACLMAVRIRNSWGRRLSFAVHTITKSSRADLQSGGIQVIDEFDRSGLGQTTIFDLPAHPDLEPGESVTSYFKLDVANARPGKHDVEFFVWDRPWATKDADSPQRRAARQIFVSRSDVDQQTGELVNEVSEGTLRLFVREMVVDQQGARRSRRPRPTHRPQPDIPSTDELRRMLEALLRGERIDPCAVRRVWDCLCACRGVGEDDRPGPGGIGNDRFFFDPFYAFPARFRYRVTPSEPFQGQFGPLPYDDPWWKALLLILAFLLLLAGLFNQASDNAYNEEKLVIGELWKSQQDDLDVAFALLNGSRSIPVPLKQALNVQDGEPGTAVETESGFVLDPIRFESPVMSKSEAETIIEGTGMSDPLRKVFKSGARTGVTRGLMAAISPWSAPREDDGTVFDLEQLRIVGDPDFEDPVSIKGDSGSVWVHSSTLRPIALHHSGNKENTRGWGAFLEDIAKRFGVTFT